MDRRQFLAALGAAWALPRAALAQGRRRPNVVLIMADDLGAECLGCYGSTTYRTPHLDALARGGVRFENAYCTPLCTPTRVELMTGQYPFRNGWKTGIWTKPLEQRIFEPAHSYIAHALKAAGYATAVAGKWQLARFDHHPHHAARCGFDAHCLWTWQYGKGKGRPSRYWDPGIWQNGKLLEGTEGKFGPDVYCDFLVDFIRQHRSRPFFAYYPMALTHGPFIRPPDATGDGGRERGGGAQRNFEAMVAYADKLVGRIVQTLDDLGLRENTLVLFTGDNGTPRQIKGSKVDGLTLRGGKNTMTEEGARVPLIAHWRGVTPRGKVLDDLMDFTDLVPTLAEVAGAELARDVVFDGRSFLPQLRGEKGDPREWILVQRGGEWYLRGKRYRLDNKGVLCDMARRYEPQKVGPAGAPPEAREARKRLEEAAAALEL